MMNFPGISHACCLHFKEFVSAGADELPPVTMSFDLGLRGKLRNLRCAFIQQRASELLICAYSFLRWGRAGREGEENTERKEGRRGYIWGSLYSIKRLYSMKSFRKYGHIGW